MVVSLRSSILLVRGDIFRAKRHFANEVWRNRHMGTMGAKDERRFAQKMSLSGKPPLYTKYLVGTNIPDCTSNEGLKKIVPLRNNNNNKIRRFVELEHHHEHGIIIMPLN